MSNEEFEKTIKEYNEQKNEQLKSDTLNKFHKKNDDRESVWKRSDEIKYGFENEYCTDSLKKERSEQHRNENTGIKGIEVFEGQVFMTEDELRPFLVEQDKIFDVVCRKGTKI